jgi:hypothetical protein
MKLPAIIRTEPAIVSQVVALLALILADAIEWIEIGLGEWAPIVGAVLAAAGITRQSVTPTSKL